jgi:hypothetical protein
MSDRITVSIRKDFVRPLHKKPSEWIPSMSIALLIDGVPHVVRSLKISPLELEHAYSMTTMLVEEKLRDQLWSWMRENTKEISQ